jgi:hypothetical protein
MSVFCLALFGPAPAEAKGKILSKLAHPVKTLRAAKQAVSHRIAAISQRKAAISQRVKSSWAGQKWDSASPRTKKWVKRGAIGVGVVAAVAVAPYVLGATGTVLSGAGSLASSLGSSSVVNGASALATKAITGSAGLALSGGKMAAGFVVNNAVPLAAGAGGAALYQRYKERKAARPPAPKPPAEPVQMTLPGFAKGLD